MVIEDPLRGSWDPPADSPGHTRDYGELAPSGPLGPALRSRVSRRGSPAARQRGGPDRWSTGTSGLVHSPFNEAIRPPGQGSYLSSVVSWRDELSPLGIMLGSSRRGRRWLEGVQGEGRLDSPSKDGLLASQKPRPQWTGGDTACRAAWMPAQCGRRPWRRPGSVAVRERQANTGDGRRQRRLPHWGSARAMRLPGNAVGPRPRDGILPALKHRGGSPPEGGTPAGSGQKRRPARPGRDSPAVAPGSARSAARRHRGSAGALQTASRKLPAESRITHGARTVRLASHGSQRTRNHARGNR